MNSSVSSLRARSTLVVALAVLFAACSGRAPRATPDGVATLTPKSTVALPTGFPALCAPGDVQVMLLGTYHFQGSERDAISASPQDYRSQVRQAELDEVVELLARWRPDQIGVEVPASFTDSTTARFARYVANNGSTTSQNEVVQVGFRLARRLGHPTVYPIDYEMPIGNDSLGALLARRPDLRRRADSVLATLRADGEAEERTNAGLSIVVRLRQSNTDEALHGGNSSSLFGSWLAAGEGANLGGPRLLARWYERNFYMAHNLTRMLLPTTRRVLLLVGSSHVPPLRNILDEVPHFCPVSPLPFLQ